MELTKYWNLVVILLISLSLVGLYYYHKKNWRYYPFRDWKYFDSLSAVGPIAAEVMKKYKQMSPILKKGTRLSFSLLNLREWQFLLLILRGLQKKSNANEKAEAEYKCFQKVIHCALLNSIELSWKSNKHQFLFLFPPVWKLCGQLFPEEMVLELLEKETSCLISFAKKDEAQASTQILLSFCDYQLRNNPNGSVLETHKPQMEKLRKLFPAKISSTRTSVEVTLITKDQPNVISFPQNQKRERSLFRVDHRFGS